jgi:glycosyltransferase involved in cell wall biosynthesis
VCSFSAQITVIIPTVCSEARATSLLHAVESAKRAAAKTPVEVLVVANGSQVHPEVLSKVAAAGARVLRQAAGSAPMAVAYGRSEVRSPFFAFLDDDDELLPGALDTRLSAISIEPNVALVVSNGYREHAGHLTPMHENMHGIDANPLLQLLNRNWLASCAGLYRTAAVGEPFFLRPHDYAEWTWLAFRLSIAGLQVRAIETLDYVVHDTPASLSKSQPYHQSYIELFNRMLMESPPAWARKRILEKRCAAYHDLSVKALQTGDLRRCCHLHLRSLWPLQGLRYLPYSRHIVARALARL